MLTAFGGCGVGHDMLAAPFAARFSQSNAPGNSLKAGKACSCKERKQRQGDDSQGPAIRFAKTLHGVDIRCLLERRLTVNTEAFLLHVEP